MTWAFSTDFLSAGTPYSPLPVDEPGIQVVFYALKRCFSSFNIHRNHLCYDADSSLDPTLALQRSAFLTSFQVVQILLVQGPRFHWQSLKRLLLIGPANSMGLQLCLTSVLLLRVQMRTLLASSILSPSCWTFDQMGALTTLIFFLL